MGDNHLGELLKKQRTDLALTLRDLEKITGISYSQLSKYERGQSTPTKANLEKIAQALIIDKQTLFMVAGFVDEEVTEQVSNIIDHHRGTSFSSPVVGAALGALVGPLGSIVGAAIGGTLGSLYRQQVGRALRIRVNDEQNSEWVNLIKKAVDSDSELFDSEKDQMLSDIEAFYSARKAYLKEQRK